ncbi:MAG: hypothetical protein CMM95_02165 [Rickettsiales bacterium]|nr:hypothetical protein [Rickettsiales bacterium]
MFNLKNRKFNFILIIVFLYLSVDNLTKFNDSNLEIGPQNNDYSSFFTEDFDKYNDSEIFFDNTYTEIQEAKRFELVKKEIKEVNEEKELTLANFNDTNVASDYVLDEKNLNLTLIPAYETMLFSGIPEPVSKPIPEKINHFKSTILSLKNKKMLEKNLETFLGKDEYKSVYDRLKEYINYNIEENITFLSDNNEKVIEIQTFAKNFQHLNLRRNTQDFFVFFYIDAPTTSKVIRSRLKVKDSVSRSLKSAEIPTSIAKEFLHQLSYTIDFQRDVKSGDIIDILYEANFTKNEKIVGDPSLLYGLMHLKDHKLELFKYTLNNGKTDYFDAYGKSIRKHLMRTPVQGARLSSRFGVRKHPILGYSRMHRGVDFAAKRGTPIMAAGDGRVVFSGRNGAFGRFIEIKHLNNFRTRYAHMYKFAKGIKKGKIVKQGEIIGYVGTSGRSTGPHLHYEVKHKNKTINPIKLKLQSTVNVEEDDMSNFYANISLTRERFLATEFQDTDKPGNYNYIK